MKIRLLKALLSFAFTAVLLSAQAHAASTKGQEEAVFAGGCFWCMESAFDEVDGVLSTTSGYTGGHKKFPTYREVGSGRTGHMESLRVVYDPDKVSYDELLKVFWANVDPTDGGGQFCDRGSEYLSAIFYLSDQQKAAAEASLAKLKRDKPFHQPVVTKVIKGSTFYPAEHYHQDYYLKNPLRYRYYRHACGRDDRLEAVWSGRAASMPGLDEDKESGFSSWLSGVFGFFSSNP